MSGIIGALEVAAGAAILLALFITFIGPDAAVEFFVFAVCFLAVIGIAFGALSLISLGLS